MIASAIWRPIRATGLSEVIGSWKIIEMSLPRIWRSACGVSRTRSMQAPVRRRKRIAPETISPPVMSVSRSNAIAETDLPEPLSPTSATVSPRAMCQETPSTALTGPFSPGKWTRRSWTSTRRSRGELDGGCALDRVRAGGRHPAQMLPVLRRRRGSSVSRRPSPEQVHAEHDEREENPGKQENPDRDHDVGAALGHDVAPARDVGRGAGAEKAENRLDDDRGGADVGRLHDQGRHGVRHDVEQQNPGQAWRRARPRRRRTAARGGSGRRSGPGGPCAGPRGS